MPSDRTWATTMHFMASNRGLHCLVTECNYKIWIELYITTKQQLHSKWIRPIGKGNPLSILANS